MSENGRRNRARSVVRQVAGRRRGQRGQRGREHAGEAGFTLAELLVVIAVLGMIAGVLAMAFVVSGKTTAETGQRLKESHDAQIASAYLATDVQSTQTLTSTTCPSTPPSGMTSLVNFKYDNPNFSTASWYYGTVDGEQQVVRAFCVSGDNVLSQAPIVHYAGATPTVTCYGAGSDTPTACTDGSKPTTVKISVVDHNAVSNTNDYAFAVSGTRRNYDATTPGTPITGYPPLFASGSSGTQLELDGNHVFLHVNGNIIVNSNSDDAVTSNSGNFDYDNLYIYGGGSCESCTYSTISYQLPDPFAGLPAPDASGLPTNPAPSGGVYQPGIYTTQFSPSGTLSPGVYVLQAGLCIAGNQSLVGSGVLLYVTGGSAGCGGYAVSISGNGIVSLSPQTGGTYAGITIWSTSTAPLSIAGNGSGTAVNGVIYAPNASQVTLGTGNGDLLIGSVIAPNITAGGNGHICVGYASLAACEA